MKEIIRVVLVAAGTPDKINVHETKIIYRDGNRTLLIGLCHDIAGLIIADSAFDFWNIF